MLKRITEGINYRGPEQGGCTRILMNDVGIWSVDWAFTYCIINYISNKLNLLVFYNPAVRTNIFYNTIVRTQKMDISVLFWVP